MPVPSAAFPDMPDRAASGGLTSMIEDLDVDIDMLTPGAPTAQHERPHSPQTADASPKMDVFGRSIARLSLADEIGHHFPEAVWSSFTAAAGPQQDLVPSPRGSPRASKRVRGLPGPLPGAPPLGSGSGSPLLDFDQLWATTTGAAVTGGPGQFDLLGAQAGGPGSAGAIPMASSPAPPNEIGSAPEEGTSGWIVPYNPAVLAGVAAAPSTASSAGATIDPYGPVYDPEGVATAELGALELEWKGPTGAAEFESWEQEAKRAAAMNPPTSIKTITDEQLAYTDLEVLMRLMRKARYTPAQIAATKKLRRKCKNRLSAKGSASKRRVQMSSIAAVNKRLVQCVSGLSSKNDQLEASNARLQAEVQAARDEASRADAEKARFQAEVDRLTELVARLASGATT